MRFKTKWLAVVLTVALMLLTGGGNAFALDGACTVIDGHPSGNLSMLTVTVTCLAGSADAGIPSTVLQTARNASYAGWFLMSIYTDPGATGPTNGAWDLVLTNHLSYAVTAGGLDNGSSTTSGELEFSPVKAITGALTQTVTGNAVNSAAFTVTYNFVR